VISDFHNALGQFLNYRLALEMTEPDRILYLAVPIDIFNTFFQERFTQAAISYYALKIIVYKPNTEEIIEWKN
ncbi:element excision factor XisH family protein, partial [Nostoc sp. DedQUE07]|uniref:element excision factor XisH family protein n=1 Tax=Nostoc sp. DedQUE07 TaxID=3075392 RepID=UPI00391BDC3F